MLHDSYSIEFQNVVQRFRRIQERPDTLREVFSKIWRRHQQLQIFEAVKQVSFVISTAFLRAPTTGQYSPIDFLGPNVRAARADHRLRAAVEAKRAKGALTHVEAVRHVAEHPLRTASGVL